MAVAQAQQQVRCCRIRRHFLIDNCVELLEENLAQQSSAIAAKDASVALGDSKDGALAVLGNGGSCGAVLGASKYN
uniref:Uncharacterized protein n=1 Tax=Oryza meridionalis TaxID=40149 RepID=A0A0E0CFI8_9ORYZ